MKQTKKELAAIARGNNEKRFTAVCKTHGETDHYTSAVQCVKCITDRETQKAERRRKDPDYREEWNEYHREYQGNRRSTDPEFVAYVRSHTTNGNTIQRLLKAGRPMPSLETLQNCREVVNETVQILPGATLDHIVPLKGRNAEGIWVVSGLHVHYNLQATTGPSNRAKWTVFNPDVYPEQRPCNGLPGGQYYGEDGIDQLESYLRMDIPIYGKTTVVAE